jgi:hypothetical protein
MIRISNDRLCGFKVFPAKLGAGMRFLVTLAEGMAFAFSPVHL